MVFKPALSNQLRQQMQRNGDTDNPLFNEPDLPECLEFFVNAFWELSTCRAFGMSQGPIPVTAVLTYAEFLECDEELTLELMEYVRLLDGLYLQEQERKQKANSK